MKQRKSFLLRMDPALCQALEAWADRHGIKPIADAKQLRGDFWPEDESIDEFIAAVRRWRREGRGGER